MGMCIFALSQRGLLVVKGIVYRNERMRDVDFYVTNVTDDHVIGWWLRRYTGAIVNKEPDRLVRGRIKEIDWKEVQDG